MIMMKPSRLWVLALFGAVLGFTQPANAVTINFLGGTAELTCTAGGVASPECEGYILGSVDGDNFPDGAGVLSGTSAYGYTVLPANPTNETLAMSIISGISVALLGTPTVTDTGGVGSLTFDTLAQNFMLKLGSAGSFFFRNNAGLVTLVLSFDSMGTSGGGFSHFTEWNVIPLPAALPMFLLALGGAALVSRRRRGVTDAA